jgi:hypothetical protein
MSEKHLTEPPWKLLVAKHGIKDLGLQKALIAYGKLDPAKEPAKAIESLADLADLAAKLKKANQANKELVTYLDEVVKEVKKTTAGLETMVKPAEATKPANEEDEQESADIKVRLTNSLKKVKTAEPGTQFPFVVCVAKPCYGLLLAKSPAEKIGAPHKKILTELTAGTKFIVGSCLFENEAHTFVVDPVPAGLAKKLKLAIKEFTGLSCKVRVRDSEGKVVADGDTDTDVDDAESPPAESPAVAPTPPSTSPSVGPTANEEAMRKFKERFKALQPEILKAIATKTLLGDEVKQRATEAGALAGKKDFESANRILDGVETLIRTAPAAAASPPPGGAAAPPKEIKLSTYLTGRANLRAARESAAKELQRLQQAILAKAADEPFYKEVEAKSQKLFDYLSPIDDAVANKLDEAGRCTDPEVQVDLNKKVRELIQKQLASLRDHILASFVEKNPFGKFIIKQPLEVTLSALDKQLS